MSDNVVELPAGDYDAVRTLRHLLSLAERGEITEIVAITSTLDAEGDCWEFHASWSDMQRQEVLWMARWFNSWLNHRYFGRYHEEG